MQHQTFKEPPPCFTHYCIALQSFGEQANHFLFWFIQSVKWTGHVFMLEVWLFLAASLPWRPVLVRLPKPVGGCTWVLQGTASSELMAPLDSFWSFLWWNTVPTVPSITYPLVLLQTSQTDRLQIPGCFEIFTWERRRWWNFFVLCYCAQSCRGVWPVMLNCPQ